MICEDMFDDTLSTWNTKAVDVELKDGTNPIFSYPHPVPNLHG